MRLFILYLVNYVKTVLTYNPLLIAAKIIKKVNMPLFIALQMAAINSFQFVAARY